MTIISHKTLVELLADGATRVTSVTLNGHARVDIEGGLDIVELRRVLKELERRAARKMGPDERVLYRWFTRRFERDPRSREELRFAAKMYDDGREEPREVRHRQATARRVELLESLDWTCPSCERRVTKADDWCCQFDLGDRGTAVCGECFRRERVNPADAGE